MKDFINKIISRLTDAIYTVKCPYCRSVIDRDECACEKCAKAFPKNTIFKFAVGGYSCIAPLPYKGDYAAAVKRFKFNNQAAYSRQLAMLLSERIRESYNCKEIDLITCVPMHKNGLKRRKYNQAELLARDCGDFLNIPYANTLEKCKESKTQHSINARERVKNVKGMYKVISKEAVKDKNILIIDDIITTGNTLGECARILEKSKCKAVFCAAMCSVN